MSSLKVRSIPLSQGEHDTMSKMGLKGSYVRAGNHGYVVSERMDLDYFKNKMPIYEDDLWIVTPPKCGTTWTQEIVWLMRNKLAKPDKNQFYRIPFLEIENLKPPSNEKFDLSALEQNEENLSAFQHNSIAFIENLPRPRIIKTHLPLDLLPDNLLDKCKVIFVTRNIKDMAVSYYHHLKLMPNEGYEFKEFAQWFKDSTILQTPMLPMVLEAWNKRNHPNLLFNTYEEMKADFPATAKKILKFLGLEMSEEEIKELGDRTSMSSFRKDVFVNKARELEGSEGKFVRKGIVGDWKEHFDPTMSQEWDRWIQDQLKGTPDFKMVTEI